MLCPYCNNTLTHGAIFCLHCRRKLYAPEAPLHVVSPGLPSANMEILPPTPLEYEGDLQHKGKRHFSVASVLRSTYFLLALLGCALLFLEWINLQPEVTRLAKVESFNWSFDNFEVLGTTLTLVGTFYLAYDLLGRHNGPLFRVSHVITTGLLGGMIVEPLALLVAQIPIWFRESTDLKMSGLSTGMTMLLTGMFLGALAGIIFGQMEQTRQAKVVSWRKALLGVGLSTAFWFYFFHKINHTPPITILDRHWTILAYGVPSGLLVGGFHRFFQGEAIAESQRPKLVSWRNIYRVSIIFVPIWASRAIISYVYAPSFFTHPGADDIVLFRITVIIVNIAYCLCGIIPSGFSRYVFWWINHLPPRRLGALGLALVLLGGVGPLFRPIRDILAILHKMPHKH